MLKMGYTQGSLVALRDAAANPLQIAKGESMSDPAEYVDGVHTREQWEELKELIDTHPTGLMFNYDSHHLHVVGCTKGFFKITCIDPTHNKSHMEPRVFFPGPAPWLQFKEWRESNGIEDYRRPDSCYECRKLQNRS